jgi:DNA-binding response OmpR family regulator
MVSNDANLNYRPCLVLAHADSRYATDTCRSFRRIGWDVYLAQTGPEARRLARMLEADMVVLDAELPEESGWLTCTKLMQERPQMQVVLVSLKSDPRQLALAEFVGARTLVETSDDLAGLLCELRGLPFSAAG